MTRCVTDWAALLYGCRESLPWPGGCGEETEVVNWDLLEKPNDCNCIVILTLSSSHRIARRFYSTLHAFTTESNPAPLWRQRQKAKWISAEVTTEWTSSSLLLSEEAKAETKSGRYLKQYLVSEGILNDCGCQKWMSEKRGCLSENSGWISENRGWHSENRGCHSELLGLSTTIKSRC